MEFLDKEFLNVIGNENHKNNKKAIECLKCLSLCHTIIADEDTDDYNVNIPKRIIIILG